MAPSTNRPNPQLEIKPVWRTGELGETPSDSEGRRLTICYFTDVKTLEVHEALLRSLSGTLCFINTTNRAAAAS
jgi:hypothetical protein